MDCYVNVTSSPLQINMDEYCGDESEEKNPYPANDYIGNTQSRCTADVLLDLLSPETVAEQT